MRPSDRAPEIVAHRRNGGVIEEVPRYWVDSPTRDVVDGAEAMALYAGPSAGLVHAVEPAAAIVAAIVADAERVSLAAPALTAAPGCPLQSRRHPVQIAYSVTNNE